MDVVNLFGLTEHGTMESGEIERRKGLESLKAQRE